MADNNERYRGRSRKDWEEEAEYPERQRYSGEQRSRRGGDDDLPYEYTQRRGQGFQYIADDDYGADYGWRGNYMGDDWRRGNRRRGRDYGREGQFSRDYGPRGNYEGEYDRGYEGHGPKGWQRADDRIEEEVNEKLARHYDIDPRNVEVSVNNGEVTLEGTVESRWMKRHMEDVVYSVFGVQDVQNRVRITREGNGSTTSEGNQQTQSKNKSTNTNK